MPPPAVPLPTFTVAGSDARTPWLALVLVGLLAIAWDLSGWDSALARAMGGGPQGFPWRDHWFTTHVLHDGVKALAWVLAIAITAGIAWPMGPLRLLDRSRRTQLALSLWLSVLLISVLKGSNPASCPWDLVEFGGSAQPLSHWAWFSRPAAGGHCFPAGHASSAFGFLGGWLVFRPVSVTWARRWLSGTLLMGAVLGLAQQWRGAHFMSHTLWTAWFCLAVAVGLNAFFEARRRRAAAA